MKQLITLDHCPHTRPCAGPLLIFGLLLALGWLITAQPVQAATLVVENANDSGTYSLRWAVNNANPGDTIVFESSLSGSTITLTSGEIVIDKALTITGLGANHLAISGANNSRVFNVRHGATVTISGVTIRDGVAGGSRPQGGGVKNAGTLTMTDCILTNNTVPSGSGSRNGGAIINAADGDGKATLTIERCLITENSSEGEGGGVGNVTYSSGSVAELTVRDSTIANNSADYGGGVAVYAQFGGAVDATFINTTVSGNSASADGGAFDVDILANGTMTRLTLINTTVHNNTAGGVGGGISTYYADSTVVLRNSIVAGNAAEGGGDDINKANLGSDVVFYGGNIVGTDAGIGLYSSGPGDQIGTPGSPIDPLLGPLADNGGPTPTHLPQTSSPAIDAGLNSTCAATDQRDESRPVDGNDDGTSTCDSGAVEVQSDDLASVAHCDLQQGETVHFRATGVSAEIVTLGSLDCLEVTLVDENHPQATGEDDGQALKTGRYWIITDTAGAADWAVNLSLLHNDVVNPKACKYPGDLGGAGWDCAATSATTHYVVRDGVTAFSDWAVGSEVSPTAVLLHHVSAAMATEVSMSVGWLLAAGLVMLTGALLRRRWRPRS